MTVLCATDLSDGGTASARAGAAVAFRLGEPLILMHVVDPPAGGLLDENALWSIRERATHLLEQEAERLKKTGLVAAVRVESGRPHEAILRVAAELRPTLIVIAASRNPAADTPAGSTARTLARSVDAPLLIVREEASIEAWAAGASPLRALLGADSTHATRAAGSWLARLRAQGPIDTTIAHVWDPDAVRDRLGLRPWTRSGAPNPELEALLERQAADAVGPMPGRGSLRLRALQREGATGTALVRAAREEGAALLVAGTSQRAGLDRLRHGSVAGEILDGARLNLCIVPAPDDGLPAAVRYRSVLAVTDLSPLGNAAVPHAYALLPAGGTVHLLHVREVEEPGETSMIIHLPKSSNPEESARESAAAAAALSALVPESSATPGVETRIEVAEAPDAADGIRQAAERLGADAIVLATRGRSGLGKALLGSVADRVLKEAGRPVLLIRSTQA